MDTGKAAFEKMMNVASDASEEAGMAEIQSLFGSMFGDFDAMKLLKKPEIQKLLASDVMRDAVEASDMPAVQLIYAQMYEQVTVERGYNFGFQFTQNMLLLIPVLILVLLFMFLTMRILKNYKEREITKDEKRRLRQLKKENAEAQRLANQNKGKTKQLTQHQPISPPTASTQADKKSD